MPPLLEDRVAYRFEQQDANAPNVAVLVKPRVGALLAPIARLAEPRHRKLAPLLLAIVRRSRGGRHRTLGDNAVRIALAFVQARRSDEAERRACRQVPRLLAIVLVRERRRIAAVNTLEGNQCPRPQLLILRIVLYEEHFR